MKIYQFIALASTSLASVFLLGCSTTKTINLQMEMNGPRPIVDLNDIGITKIDTNNIPDEVTQAFNEQLGQIMKLRMALGVFYGKNRRVPKSGQELKAYTKQIKRFEFDLATFSVLKFEEIERHKIIITYDFSKQHKSTEEEQQREKRRDPLLK